MDQTIKLIERRLGQLRAMISQYTGKPPQEKWLASEIIDWQIRRNEYSHNHLTPIPLQPLIPTPSSVQRLTHLQLATSVQHPLAIPNEMPVNHTEISRQTASSRAYWQPGQPFGAPTRYFRQIRYLSLPNAVPDLDKALSGALLDCGQDLQKQLGEFGGAVKV